MPTDTECRPPLLPRTEWEDHPRFPAQALLLGSHAGFRHVSHVLVDAAEGGAADDPVTRRSLRLLFERWQAAMGGGHEHYEEHKLFPYLERRWGVSTSALAEGHRELDALRVIAREAFAAVDATAITAALRAFDEAVRRHLDAEEEIVLPCLLALDPEEFEAFVSRPLESVLEETVRACVC